MCAQADVVTGSRRHGPEGTFDLKPFDVVGQSVSVPQCVHLRSLRAAQCLSANRLELQQK